MNQWRIPEWLEREVIVRDRCCVYCGVEFAERVVRTPMRTLVCHCTFCQRLTGTSFYVESLFPTDGVEFNDGEARTYAHTSDTSGRKVHVHFCPHCGTTLGLTFERWPDIRAMSRSCLDVPNAVEIDANIWTRSAQTGVALLSGIDCFAKSPFVPNGQTGSPGSTTPQSWRATSATVDVIRENATFEHPGDVSLSITRVDPFVLDGGKFGSSGCFPRVFQAPDNRVLKAAFDALGCVAVDRPAERQRSSELGVHAGERRIRTATECFDEVREECAAGRDARDVDDARIVQTTLAHRVDVRLRHGGRIPDQLSREADHRPIGGAQRGRVVAFVGDRGNVVRAQMVLA